LASAGRGLVGACLAGLAAALAVLAPLAAAVWLADRSLLSALPRAGATAGERPTG
jgi:hypothetical protein